jgi:hypothetical protein
VGGRTGSRMTDSYTKRCYRTIQRLLPVTVMTVCPACATGPEDCNQSVTVEISAAMSPQFSWVPNCELSHLSITDQIGTPTWVIHGVADRNTIGSPVRYGVLPDGIQQEGDAVPLEIGATYRLVLFWTDFSEGRVLKVATDLSFRAGQQLDQMTGGRTLSYAP